MAGVPKDELKRKGFHLVSLIYVFGYWYLDKAVIVWGLAAAIAVVASLELLRFNVPKFNEFFCDNFKGFYRPDEAKKVSGLLGTLAGALITVLSFSNKYMVFASFLYLSFGDSSAALVGKTIGKHKTLFGKSLEGSLACFAACFICGLFIFNWKFALLGAFAATIIEAIPWKINDNFWMQIINAAILTVFSGVMVWAK
jgi:dolichol kinase